jgi:hypothetical protein
MDVTGEMHWALTIYRIPGRGIRPTEELHLESNAGRRLLGGQSYDAGGGFPCGST